MGRFCWKALPKPLKKAKFVSFTSILTALLLVTAAFLYFQVGQHIAVVTACACFNAFALVFLAATLIQLVFYDPGYVQQFQLGVEREGYVGEGPNAPTAEGGVLEWSDFCQACETLRPLQAHHCGVCGRCVRGFDHHCGVFNACIASGTVGYFLKFMLGAGVYLLTNTGLLAAALVRRVAKAGSVGSIVSLILMGILLLYAFLFGVQLAIQGVAMSWNIVFCGFGQVDRLQGWKPQGAKAAHARRMLGRLWGLRLLCPGYRVDTLEQ